MTSAVGAAHTKRMACPLDAMSWKNFLLKTNPRCFARRLISCATLQTEKLTTQQKTRLEAKYIDWDWNDLQADGNKSPSRTPVRSTATREAATTPSGHRATREAVELAGVAKSMVVRNKHPMHALPVCSHAPCGGWSPRKLKMEIAEKLGIADSGRQERQTQGVQATDATARPAVREGCADLINGFWHEAERQHAEHSVRQSKSGLVKSRI